MQVAEEPHRADGDQPAEDILLRTHQPAQRGRQRQHPQDAVDHVRAGDVAQFLAVVDRRQRPVGADADAPGDQRPRQHAVDAEDQLVPAGAEQSGGQRHQRRAVPAERLVARCGVAAVQVGAVDEQREALADIVGEHRDRLAAEGRAVEGIADPDGRRVHAEAPGLRPDVAAGQRADVPAGRRDRRAAVVSDISGLQVDDRADRTRNQQPVAGLAHPRPQDGQPNDDAQQYRAEQRAHDHDRRPGPGRRQRRQAGRHQRGTAIGSFEPFQ